MSGQKWILPEVLESDETLPADLVALRRFAYLMDEAVAIPGTRRRIGVDAAIGLIPGIGDIIGGLLSAWIVIGAVRHRVSALKITRMMINVLLHVGLGLIPVIGALFDLVFEENVTNVQILIRHRNRQQPPRSARQMVWFAAGIVSFILFTSVAMVVGLIVLVIWLIGKR